ncbi:MAG: hypothetical protein H6797_00925 [Candidatus Nomurabacteria bacterium]|nr:MAG: hypothetical protein H6797_00925 [Candidatus Nomurabacteria bacterium]
MGFFDEFTDFVGEIKSIKNELTDIGDGVVKDITSSASEVKKTVGDTATELKSSANEIKSTLQQTGQLETVQETTSEPSTPKNQ